MATQDILQPYSDPTGKMSQAELNAQDISNLIDAVNNLQASSSNILNTSTAEIAFNGTTNKAVFGYQNGLQQWGIFVGKDGVDALNDSNPNNFVFNSNQDALKVVITNTTTVASYSAPNGIISTNSVSVNLSSFNLTTPPVVLAYTSYFNGSNGVPWTGIDFYSVSVGSGVSLLAFGRFEQNISTTNITFTIRVYNGLGSAFTTPQYNIRYYVLQETVAS